LIALGLECVFLLLKKIREVNETMKKPWLGKDKKKHYKKDSETEGIKPYGQPSKHPKKKWYPPEENWDENEDSISEESF
jgi:hypothetical protein